MPKIHNPDWSSLDLADFPQFKCLCELCDCGCFERSKLKHSDGCKKSHKYISKAFESDLVNKPPFYSSTNYTDAYKKIEFKPLQTADHKFVNKKGNNDKTIKIEFPIKFKPKADSIELTDKDVKLSTHTTNRDHFKSWNSSASQPSSEYPEFTSKLIYPNEKRRFQTTNDEMFYKNYGLFGAKSSAINVFENTFKINQGKMNLNTVYANDYKEANMKEILSDRGPLMTREMVERKNMKHSTGRIPMLTRTSKMDDFKYDPDTFRSVAKSNRDSSSHSLDLFKSKLNKNLNPFADDFTPAESSTNADGQSELSYRANNEPHNLTHNKNIRFITTFDNNMIPALKIIKKLPPIGPPESNPKSGDTNRSVDLNDLFDDHEARLSTYRADFKDRGVDVCMAKAYKILAEKKPKNTDQLIVH